jgi:hypothetical protein
MQNSAIPAVQDSGLLTALHFESQLKGEVLRAGNSQAA